MAAKTIREYLDAAARWTRSLTGATGGGDPPGKDIGSFGDELIDRLTKQHPDCTINRLAPEFVQLEGSGDFKARLHIGGYHGGWKRDAVSMDEILSEIRGFIGGPDTGGERNPPIDGNRVMPVLAAGRFLDYWRSWSGEDDEALVTAPWLADLQLTFFEILSGMSLRPILASDLDQLGLDVAALEDQSRANLARDPIPFAVAENTWRGRVRPERSAHIGLTASQLLRTDAWADIACRSRAGLLAVVPEQGTVYVGPDHPRGLSDLRDAANEVIANPDDNTLTTTVLRWTPAGWEPAFEGRAMPDGGSSGHRTITSFAGLTFGVPARCKMRNRGPSSLMLDGADGSTLYLGLFDPESTPEARDDHVASNVRGYKAECMSGKRKHVRIEEHAAAYTLFGQPARARCVVAKVRRRTADTFVTGWTRVGGRSLLFQLIYPGTVRKLPDACSDILLPAEPAP